MRIIAGKWRGRRLQALGKGDAQAQLRPTQDRVREALFSSLHHQGVIEDAAVLDLFAGTGALGFEALSRGAAHAIFVENGRVGGRLIAENIERLDAQDEAQLIRGDATKPGVLERAAPVRGFDLVFLDPPYGRGLGQVALEKTAGLIAQHAFVVWEEATPMEAPPGFLLETRKQFGDTHVTMLRRDRNDDV